MKVAIIDYGQGNISSVATILKHHNVDTLIAYDSTTILKADKIILPGVGHFATAMENIHRLGILSALNEAVLERKKPVLGICLGMQLMGKYSEEGDTEGLGWVDSEVKRLKFGNPFLAKIPHTGWNGISIFKTSHPLFCEIRQNTEFYFTHAYHVILKYSDEELGSAQYYDQVFTAALCSNNIFGVQFHPEKSHRQGQSLIDNFIKL